MRTGLINPILLVAGFALSSPAQASILFEGYSKVLLSGAHVGFAVQSYTFDEKTKEFSAAYLLRTSTDAGSVTESLKARATFALNPISYSYTSLVGTKTSSIDAVFKGNTATLTIREGGKVRTTKTKFKKGVFLSTFVVYLMLQGKDGIKTGAKYSYEAIAEEDGTLNKGEAYVQGRETVAGESAFKVLNTFKGSQFVSLVTGTGEVLATRLPSQSLATELVATREEATAGQAFSAPTAKMIFGRVPEGIENAISRKAAGESKTAAKPSTRALQPKKLPTENAPVSPPPKDEN